LASRARPPEENPESRPVGTPPHASLRTPPSSRVTPPGPIPAFNKPPVTETVLSVQFAPLKAFSIPHFGLFWRTVREDYPRSESQPPLASVIEKFEAPPTADQMGLALISEPEARCWFLDPSGTELLQVQRDRFIRNWRKVTGGEEYPRYQALRPRFARDWGRFIDFLERERFGRPEVNQCEVTYINQLPVSVGSLGEAHRFVRALSPLSGEFLPEPETAHLNVSYIMGDKQGRLHVSLQPAIRRDDGRAVLQLTLTARGTPHSSRLEDLLSWFDLGREWVVRGFSDFTRQDMHAVWERTQ